LATPAIVVSVPGCSLAPHLQVAIAVDSPRHLITVLSVKRSFASEVLAIFFLAILEIVRIGEDPALATIHVLIITE